MMCVVGVGSLFTSYPLSVFCSGCCSVFSLAVGVAVAVAVDVGVDVAEAVDEGANPRPCRSSWT